MDKLISQMLCKPGAEADIVIDADAAGGTDCRFALSYALRAQDKINLLCVFSAPCGGETAATPAEGEAKSFAEIKRLLTLADRAEIPVKHGADAWLQDGKTPVACEGVDELIRLARQHSPQKPLYLLAFGTLTLAASALLSAPDITQSLVIIWVGGNAWQWPYGAQADLDLDISAARVVFASDASFVQLPAAGVVSALTVSRAELLYYLSDKDELCTYLLDCAMTQAERYAAGTAWTLVMWDAAAVAWLFDDSFMIEKVKNAPMPCSDGSYSFTEGKSMKYVYQINRDAVVTDMLRRIIGRSL